jgi:hypothetical protein
METTDANGYLSAYVITIALQLSIVAIQIAQLSLVTSVQSRLSKSC